jgi:hypothetical protein
MAAWAAGECHIMSYHVVLCYVMSHLGGVQNIDELDANAFHAPR